MIDKTKEILKGAVATTRGWVNPATGELLVSIRGLPGAIEWSKDAIASIKTSSKVVETAKPITDNVKETKQEVAETSDKPAKAKKTKKAS